MEKLHSGAKWIFRFQAYGILMILFFFFLVYSLGIVFQALISNSISIPIFLGSVIILYLIVSIIIGEIYSNLAYHNWKFEFTEEGLKKEKGIIFKKYSSIPYQRIQNIDIHRGILARLLGFSSIMIHTAGYSGVPNAEGNIPAVDTQEAEKIRSLIMKKITSRRS